MNRLLDLLSNMYGYLIGLPFYCLIRLFASTCRRDFVDVENLESRSNHIFALWHEHNLPFFIAFPRHKNPHVWVNHPMRYMRPIHVVIYFMGVKKLAMGSSGNSGRKAADEVVHYLKQGYSTFINPDGPSGPIRKAHKGVLHMAQQADIPITPLVIETSASLRIPFTWDHKRLPLPFSKLKIYYGQPIYIKGDIHNYVEVLEKALSRST